MSDFGLKMKTFLDKFNDASIIIQDHITVKIINSLGLKFETYVTVLNKKVWNEKKLPDLDSLLKNLKKEEISMVGKFLLNNVQTSFSSKFFQDSSGGKSQRGCGNQGSCGNQGKCCDHSGSKGGNSSTLDYKNITYFCCQKIEHIANHCMELT